MTKTNILKNLRIAFDKQSKLYYVCVGEGLEYRCFSASVSEKAAKSSRADVRKNPAEYGIV